MMLSFGELNMKSSLLVQNISVGKLIFSFGFQAFDDAIAQLDTLNEESYKVGRSLHFMHFDFVIHVYKILALSPSRLCAFLYFKQYSGGLHSFIHPYGELFFTNF